MHDRKDATRTQKAINLLKESIEEIDDYKLA